VVLVALGLAMLALGIWVEDRPAVAAPLVILGALIVVVALIWEEWADSILELSLSTQVASATVKRQVPTAEELAKAGLPEEAAEEIWRFLEAITEWVPAVIDQRVRKVLAERAAIGSGRRALYRRFVEQQRQQGDEQQGPD